MSKMGYVRLLSFFTVFAGCGGLFAGSPPPELPEPPAENPEPLLVVHGQLFAYEVGGLVLADLGGPGMIGHELEVDGVLVRLRTPPGWTAQYAGAVWMQFDEESRARFVIHLAEDHEKDFHEYWYGRDEEDPAATVSEVNSIDSGRRPFLYTYCRSDDGRCGVVYALLTESGRPDTGIIVHGVWPAEYDRRLRPIAVAAANGVSLSGI